MTYPAHIRKKILADGGYTGKAFASSVQELMGAEVKIAKRNELHRLAVFYRSGGW